MANRTALLAVLACLVLLCHWGWALASSDACTVKSGDLLTFEQTLDCVLSVPFSDQIRTGTIESINRTLPMYVFLYASMQSPDPLIPVHFDIQSAIEEIAQLNGSVFDSDWSFHHALFEAFRDLIDGHTVYLMPSCYSKFTLVQPFRVVSYFDAGIQKQVLQIAGIADIPGILEFYWDQFGFNLTEYVGAQITHIYATDAIEYVTEFANQRGGGYKDVGTRFNNAIASQLCTRPLHRSDLPEYEVFSWQLNMPGAAVLINVPWVGLASATFADQAEFASVCHGASTSRMTAEFTLNPEEEIRQMLVGDGKSHEITVEMNGNSTFQQLVKGDMVNFFRHVDSNVGVLQVQSFVPHDNAQFVRDVQNSLFYARLFKLDKLLIDVTNNGGGEICLGYALTKYLFPVDFQSDFGSLFGRTDMIQSELGEQIAQAAATSNVTFPDSMWTPSFWRDDNGNVFQNASWFSPGVKRNHGGVEALYTSWFKEGYCEEIFSGLNFANNTENLPGESKFAYKPDDIILLSNGRCASTCSLFSKRLQQDRRAKVLVVGGVYGQAQMFSGVPGGQVYNLDALHEDLAMYNLLESPYAPPKLPTKAVLSFTIREAYAWRQDLPDRPLEFLYEPAHFRMPYTRESVDNINLVWLDAIRFFNVCTPNIVPPSCKIDGGIGQRKCDTNTGHYSDACEIVACHPGFGFSQETKICTPCEAGTFKSDTDLSSCKPCSNKPSWSHWNASITGVSSDQCPFVCDLGFALHQDTMTCAVIEGDLASMGKIGLGAVLGFLSGVVLTALLAGIVAVLVFVFAIKPKLSTEKDHEKAPLVVNRH